jgi:short-subunit dehydrogenase
MPKPCRPRCPLDPSSSSKPLPGQTRSSRLAGQRAVVTGATSGIGQAIAELLAERGADVWAVGRREHALHDLAARLDGIRPFRADLGDDQQVTALGRALAAEGEVDILVHAAAIITLGRFAEAPVDGLDAHYRMNVRAPYLLTQTLLPQFSARAQIVFLNSSAGLAARAGVVHYAASKHALKALADSLREELHASGRRVLNVFAGRTATPMQAAMLQAEGRPYDLGRLIDPVELAGLIVTALDTESMEIKELNVRPRFE